MFLFGLLLSLSLWHRRRWCRRCPVQLGHVGLHGRECSEGARPCVENDVTRCDDSWDGSCRETKTLFHTMETIEVLAQPSDRSSAVSAPSLFGEDSVWPSSAALAKADFTNALRLKVGRSVAHEVKTTYFTAHSYLQALFKKQNIESDTFLLNNSLGLLPYEFLAHAQAFG